MPIKKKKQSRFARLGARLKTPKGRLVATVLVFAVVGGGIFVYKSFAATAAWGYQVSYGNLYGSASIDCSQSTSYDSQFKTNVLSLFCKQNAIGPNGASARTRGSWLPKSYVGSQLRFCAYIKGTGQNIEVRSTVPGQGMKIGFYIVNSSSYGYYCSPYATLKAEGGLDGEVLIRPSSKVNWINVGGIVLEKK